MNEVIAETTKIGASMDWTQVIAVFAVIATNLGTTIAFFLNLDKKIEENRKETNLILRGIQDEIKGMNQEMKDFHTRLALQDLEFKHRLCAIEERVRK